MPLPSTRVIDDRWSQHHRPVATGAMTATCVITRAATAGTTGADGTWTPGPRTDVYEGPCRAYPFNPVGGEKRVVSGERQTTQRGYRVQIKFDTPTIVIGDIVEITDAADAGMVGVKLRVSDVKYAWETFARDMIANEIESGS